ncbi:MAG TPA: hypothetical protein VGN16_12285 [Acidobacteriaceae bacterium]
MRRFFLAQAIRGALRWRVARSFYTETTGRAATATMKPAVSQGIMMIQATAAKRERPTTGSNAVAVSP